MQESKSCSFTISLTLECKSSAYPWGPLPLPLSYLHRIAMFILPLPHNASVLRQEFTEDFSSARTRTQTTRTRILYDYQLHNRGMNERLFIRTVLFDFHHLVTSQTEMSNWEGHKDLLCALSILALSKPIVLIRCGRTRTCDVLKLAGFGDQCSRLCATHLLLETGMGVEPTTTGFADQPPNHSGFPSKMYRMRQDSNLRSPLLELARFQVEYFKPAQPRIHKICVPSISPNHPVHQSQNEVCYHILWLCPFCNQHSPRNVLSKTLLHPEHVPILEIGTSDLEGQRSAT